MAIVEDSAAPTTAPTGTGSPTGTNPCQMQGASGTLTTGTFSPPANSVVVCMTSLGWGSAGAALTITDSSDANATPWTKVESALGSGSFGSSVVSYRRFVSAPGAISVRVVDTSASFDQFIYIKTLTGVDMVTPTGATALATPASTTTYTASITTTAAGSYVAGVCDQNTTGAFSTTFTAASATTVLGQWDNGIGDGTATAAFKQTSLTSSPGATTLGVTSTRSSPGTIAMAEFMPAGAAPSSPPAARLPLGFPNLRPGRPTPMSLFEQVTLGSRTILQAAFGTGSVNQRSGTGTCDSTFGSISTPWIGTAVGGNVAGTNGTSATVDVSGATNGEVCFIFGFLGDTERADIIPPAGWKDVGQAAEGTSGASSSRGVAFWKVKQSGDTTVTITDPTNWNFSTKSQWVPISWPGLDRTSPFEDLTWATRSAGSVTTYPTGSATPALANRWAVTLSGARGTTAATAWTADAALTERVGAVYTSSVFLGLEIADSNGPVTQAAHSYTATGQAASHAVMGLLFLIPASTPGLCGVKGGVGTGTSSARATTVSSGSAVIAGATGVGVVAQRTSTSDTGVKGGIGTGTAAQRSSTVDTGTKGGVGVGAASQRSAVVATGIKGAAGVAVVAQRNAVVGVSRKQGTGVGITPSRTSTTATGTKGGVGVGVPAQRTSTTGTGAKRATGTGAVVQRSNTIETGATVTGISGTGVVAQHSTTTTTAIKRAVGTGTVATRTSTTSAGLKAVSAAGVVTQRSSTVGAAQKQATAVAVVAQRSTVAGTGRKQAVGAAITPTRTTTTGTGQKNAVGAASDSQRTSTVSSGQQFTGKAGIGQTYQRSSVQATGTKSVVRSADVTCRTSTTGTGVHKGTGSGLAATRPLTRATGLHSTTAVATVTQRTSITSSIIKQGVAVGRVQQRSSTVGVHLLDQTDLRIRIKGREPVTMSAGRESDTSVLGREPDQSVAGREPDLAITGREPDSTISGREKGTP